MGRSFGPGPGGLAGGLSGDDRWASVAMHESGIVQSLLAAVDEQVRGHHGKRAVRVVLGVDGRHIDEQFLRGAFDMFKSESTAHDAELIVTHAPVELWCADCGATTRVATHDTTCPSCGGAGIAMTSSDEIYLQSVEIEV